ncbi:MAG TPA: Ig-like domain repeat protein [Methylomirabilota bacterium]|nr:Ig-like domain repeat protein [Methylomirabilota bacterium]
MTLLAALVVLAVLCVAGPAAAQTWIHLAPTGGPPTTIAYQPTAVRDPASGRLILYGRNLSNVNEVWVLDNPDGLGGTPAWKQRIFPTGSTLPANRGNHAAVYDAGHNRMIIFGGCGGGCFPVLNDVWVLTSANDPTASEWIQLAPASDPTWGAPAPRHAVAAGYDPASNRMVIFGGHTGGGSGGTTYSDVWVLLNANGLNSDGLPTHPAWKRLFPAGGPPPGQYNPSFVYDAGNHRLIVVGGAAQGTGLPTNATWVLSDATGLNGIGVAVAPTWTNLVAEGAAGSPPAFGGTAEYYDAAHNRLMLVLTTGLWTLANANGLESGASTWTQLTPTGGPPSGGAGPNMAVYTPGSNRATVLFSTATDLQSWVLTSANGLKPAAVSELWASSSDGTNPGSLFTVDRASGLATLVGTPGLPDKLTAIDFDPTTGQLYGIMGSACSGADLYRIDRRTAAATFVGTLVGAGFDGSDKTYCIGGADSMAFAPDGTLYAGGWKGGFGAGTLLKIDKASGAVLEAHPTSGGVHLAGLAFDGAGRLWASHGGNSLGVIHIVETATGSFLSTITLSDAALVSDLAFTSDGTLYASLPGGDTNHGVGENKLAIIDPATGNITRVGSFGSAVTKVSSLAAAPRQQLLGSSSGGGRTGTGTNPSGLFSIDETTGTATLIALSGLPDKLTGIDVDPVTGELYAIVGSALSGAHLYRIDSTTAASIFVGTLVAADFAGAADSYCVGSDSLAFAPDGTLYAGGWMCDGGAGGSLLRLDKATGTVLEIHPTPMAADGRNAHLAGLAFDSTGVLWASRGGNAPGKIHTVDLATGSFTATINLSDGGAVVSDLAFANGVLYASLAQENTLATIDPQTGLLTRIGSFGPAVTRMSALSATFSESQAPSTTTVDSTPNPSTPGQSVTFTAGVTSGGHPVSNGWVTFKEGSTVLAGPLTLPATGKASFSTSALSIGTHTITAEFSGTFEIAASSGSVSHVVQKASQMISVTLGAPEFAAYNTSFDVAASASSGLAVSITASGVCVITSGGSAAATIGMTSGTGVCTVSFNQTGDATYEPAPQVQMTTTAQKASQSISQSGAPGSATFGTSFDVTALATSGLDVTIGSSGACSGSGISQATITMTSGTGTCTLTFDQAGDDNYTPATLQTFTTALKAGQTITVTQHAPAAAFFDATFTVAATASSGLPVSITTSGVCSGGGTATALVTMLSGTGTCSVQYDQSGNADYEAVATVTESTTAQRAASNTVLVTNTTPSQAGAPVTFTATVTPGLGGSGTPTGTVQFQDNGVNVGGPVSLVGGVAAFSISTLTPGAHTISAVYGGDGNFNGSSASVSQTVNAIATMTTVVSSPNPSTFGQPVTLTATVARAGDEPTWIKLAPAGGPSPLPGDKALFDAVNNRRIVFGSSLSTSEVWVLTNADGLGGEPAWIQLAPSGTPPAPRHGHTAVYDSNSNRMIVFGGCAGGCFPLLNDVWVLTNANGLGGTPEWINLIADSAAGSPAAREHAVSVYDPGTNRMILFGGQDGVCCAFPEVWVLENANGLGGAATWSQILGDTAATPAGQYGASAIYDAGSNRMTVFGGRATQNGPQSNAVSVLVDANGLGTPHWIGVIADNAAGSPPARQFHAAVYDAANNRMSLTGGCDFDACFSDVWVLADANGLGTPAWTQLSPSPGPVQPYGAVYRPQTNRMLVLDSPSRDAWVLTNANGLGAPGPAPTGAVEFFDGETSLGAATLSAIAPYVAEIIRSSLNGGNHTITAPYPGDTSFAGSSSAPLIHVVDRASQLITMTGAPATAVFNTTFGMEATASSSLDVTITADGACSGGGTGSATITMTSGTGTCTVAASQGGNDNYEPAPSLKTSTTALKASQTITVTQHAPASATYLTPGSFTVAATAGSGLPVAITTTGTPCFGSGSGSAIVTLTSGTGSCVVHYNQFGDDNYGAAAEITETTVAQTAPTTTALSSSPNPSVFGQAVTLTAVVMASGGGTATGSVQFIEGPIVLGSGALSATAPFTATFSTSGLSANAPGTFHSITARYVGDTNFTSSDSTPLSQVVNPVATSTTLTSSPNPSTIGETITLTATVAAVSGASATPSGIVVFRDGPVTLGSASLSAGLATFTTSALGLGYHELTAAYGGTTGVDVSTSLLISQNVISAPTITGVTYPDGTTSLPLGCSTTPFIISGIGFQAGLTVTFSAAGVTANGIPAQVTDSTITLDVTVASNAAQGPGTVTVRNPDAVTNPDRGTVTSAPIVVVGSQACTQTTVLPTPPASSTPTGPTIASLTPTQALRGATLTIGGSAFATSAGSNTVTFTSLNGTPIQVAASSVNGAGTSLTVTIPSTTATGPVTVTVSGLTSNAATLTITDPQVANVVPGTVFTGASIIVDVTGTNLTATMSVQFFNTGTTTVPSGLGAPAVSQFIDSSHVKVTFAASAPTGALDVRITNADGGRFTLTGALQVVQRPLAAFTFQVGLEDPAFYLPTVDGVNVTLDATGRCTGKTVTPHLVRVTATFTTTATTFTAPTQATVAIAPSAIPGTATNEDCELTTTPADDFGVAAVGSDPAVAGRQVTVAVVNGVAEFDLFSFDWGGNVQLTVSAAATLNGVGQTVTTVANWPVDTDNDGLPDAWESDPSNAGVLDPLNADKNGNGVADGQDRFGLRAPGDGLTNLAKFRGVYLVGPAAGTSGPMTDLAGAPLVARLAAGQRHLFVRGSGFADDPFIMASPGTCGTNIATMSNSINPGATTVPVFDTTGFPSSGTGILGGTGVFKYTGLTATSFTGVTGVIQTWGLGTSVFPATTAPTPDAALGANPCPNFEIGGAFAERNIATHDVTRSGSAATMFPRQSLMTPSTAILDVATVYYDGVNCSGGSCEHIQKLSGTRQWTFATLGSSDFGSSTAYGASIRVYKRAFNGYFTDRPYKAGTNVPECGPSVTSGTQCFVRASDGTRMLAPTTLVADADDNGYRTNNKEPVDGTGVLLSDVYDAGSFGRQLSAMAALNDGCVQLPLVTDPRQLARCTATDLTNGTFFLGLLTDGVTPDPRATRRQVMRHLITHEVGHGVGVTTHTGDASDLMYQSSNNWRRDGHFSDTAAGQLQIHNGGLQ